MAQAGLPADGKRRRLLDCMAVRGLTQRSPLKVLDALGEDLDEGMEGGSRWFLHASLCRP